MSKQTLVKEIKKELSRLNDDIDMMIVKGVSYRVAARRHKFLMKQLAQLERRSKAPQVIVKREVHPTTYIRKPVKRTLLSWFGVMGKSVASFIL